MAHVKLEEPSDAITLLKSWRHRARQNQKAHYAMAQRADRFAFWFGTAAAIMSGVVGIIIIFAARTTPSSAILLTIATLSIVSSVITTIATSAKWSDKAAQHHAAGAAYGVLHRRVEQALALPPPSGERSSELADALRVEFDLLPMKAPPIPNHIWRTLPEEVTPSRPALPNAAADG